jgi:hypothetical protein
MESVAACTLLQLRLLVRTNHLMRWQLTHGQPLLLHWGTVIGDWRKGVDDHSRIWMTERTGRDWPDIDGVHRDSFCGGSQNGWWWAVESLGLHRS